MKELDQYIHEKADAQRQRIVYNIFAPNIMWHYFHAKEKHPYFCDALLPHRECSREQIYELIGANLALARNRIKMGVRYGNVIWNELLNCEVWEATEAIANGDEVQAVEELYDCVAVLLRTIDVLEGRQKLGKPTEDNKENDK